MAEVAEGKRAPQFTLPANTGKKVALKDFMGKKNVVLFFYPRASSSTCTKEVVSFRDLHDKFKKAGAVVIGISADEIDDQIKFAEKNDLKYPLLSDVDAKVCEKYGVWQEKSMYGRKFMGIVRSTFIIDKGGKIANIWPKVKVTGHAEEVLEAVKGLAK